MRFNFRYIFSIGGEHFKVRAYRIYIYFYAEKFFCLIFRGQGQFAGGSYLRISLYVLMIHFKMFGTFIRSVPTSRLSNQTIVKPFLILQLKKWFPLQGERASSFLLFF